MKETLIDTDIFSYYMKGNPDVVKKVLEYSKYYPVLNLSSITYYEILGGLEHKNAKRQIKDFERLLSRCNIIHIDLESIRLSAKEYGKLRRKGITIGNSDLLIAGIALANGYILATNNTNHFQNIEELELNNWKENG